MSRKLSLISSVSEEHQGYGAGEGTVDTDIYECPCGKSTVTFTADRIPGFREKSVWIDCPECCKKYGSIKSISELEMQLCDFFGWAERGI